MRAGFDDLFGPGLAGPRRHPAGPRRIDWSHPQTTGLAAFVYSAGDNRLYDAVSGRRAAATGTMRQRGGPEGLCHVLQSGATSTLAPIARPMIHTGAVTLMVRCRVRVAPTTGLGRILFFGSGAGFRGPSIALDQTTDAVVWGANNSAGYALGGSYGAHFIDEAHTFGAVGNGNNNPLVMTGYLDGVSLGLGAGVGNVTTLLADTLYGNLANSAEVEIVWAAAFNRLLNAPEMAWWHANALEVLEPEVPALLRTMPAGNGIFPPFPRFEPNTLLRM